MPRSFSIRHETFPINPQGIPERIVGNPAHQPRAKRVEHQIPCGRDHVVVAAQRPIVEAISPDAMRPIMDSANGSRRCCLHPTNRRSDRLPFSEFDPAMPVVWHEHPCQQAGGMPVLILSERIRHGGGATGVGKSGATVPGREGDQIDLTGEGHTTASQGAIAWFRGVDSHRGSVHCEWSRHSQ
jgi:hypothetical protein